MQKQNRLRTGLVYMRECGREKADGASLMQDCIEPARELLHESAAHILRYGRKSEQGAADPE